MFRAVFFCVTLFAAGQSAIIETKLQHSLRAQPTNIVITMKSGIKPAISRSRRLANGSRTARINNLVSSLESHAAAAQAPVMNLLSRERSHIQVQSFWASNSIFIRDADATLVAQLAELDEVEEIHQEHIVYIEPIIENASNTTAGQDELQWGIERIHAQDTWANGNIGEGIVVGSIDTGIRGTHRVLRDNFVGLDKNGWFDPYKKSAEPNDGNGHGTHTMGTIAGSNGYGVAPGAKWLSCKGCDTSRCTEEALLACGQYILCPTDTSGNNKNCALAPHVSSNSWGGGSNQMWYMNIVKAWREAGIIPVFAQGNSGNQCGTANSPGDYENVIGVGASTFANGLASFSSVGPTRTKLMKPDVSAPGHQVNSAWFDGDNSYKTISGTSMACPHVAGAVALLMAHDSNLDYDGIYNALTLGSSQNLQPPNKNCGGIQDTTYPNNMFGWGVIHTENAIGSIGGEPPVTDAPTDPPAQQCVRDFFSRCTQPRNCFGAGWGWGNACKTPCQCP